MQKNTQKYRRRNAYMLTGRLKQNAYDWWWHSFVGVNEKTGEEKPFFIEYYFVNPSLGGKDPIFGQKIYESGEKKLPSYGLIKAGAWGKNKAQIHNFYGIEDTFADTKAMHVVIGNNFASEKRLCGSVTLSEEDAKNHPEYMSDSGTMSWDLEIEKELSYCAGYGTSRFFRRIAAFEMFWHVQGMKSRLKGKVIYNGEVYNVNPENSFGYQDKNWGRDYTSPWIWLNCNNFISEKTSKHLENTSLDVGGGRPVVLGKALERKILTVFYHEGKLYEFNFSKFYKKSFTQNFNCYETDKDIVWEVRSEDKHSKLEIDFTCKKDTMLHVNYENPKGEKKHNKLWNGGYAIGTVKLYQKEKNECILVDTFKGSLGGCEYGEYDS